MAGLIDTQLRGLGDKKLFLIFILFTRSRERKFSSSLQRADENYHCCAERWILVVTPWLGEVLSGKRSVQCWLLRGLSHAIAAMLQCALDKQNYAFLQVRFWRL
jgi:hypothetical protein